MTPWYYYLEYGDRRILEENYPMMKGYVSHLESVSDNGVLKNYAHMGEWGQLHEETPTPLVATCAFFLITNTMIRIAEILERREDAESYEGLAERIRSGFYQDGECFGKKAAYTETAVRPASAASCFPASYGRRRGGKRWTDCFRP